MELAAENLPSFYSSVPQTFLSVSRSYDALGRPDAVALKVGQTFLSATSYEEHRDLVSSVSHKVTQTFLSVLSYTNDPLGRRTTMSRSGSAFAAVDEITCGYNDRTEVTPPR